MANPQLEEGHVRIANEIIDEVIRRDFSKRQKDILHLIWRLSYGCGKKSATIPKLKDFSLCGVTKQNVKGELEHLETCRVIIWDREENKFTFNKNHEEWIITPGKGFKEEEYKQLVHLNIQEKFLKQEPKSSQNKNSNHAQEEGSSQNKNQPVLKIRTNEFLKQELSSKQIPSLRKVKQGSKDRFKDILKTFTTTTSARKENLDVGTGTPETVKKEVVPTSTALLNRYLELRGQMNPSPKDQEAAYEVEREGVPAQEAVQYLEQKFQDFEQKKKHHRDKINGLSYCVGYILDQYHKSKEDATNDSGIQKYSRQSGSNRSGYGKGQSYAEAMRELESAERAWS